MVSQQPGDLELSSIKHREYREFLMKLPEEVLEEIASKVEADTSMFLREKLPPRTDFNVSVSIIRDDKGVDVVVDVMIRGRLEQYSVEVRDAVNYAKKRLVEILEELKKQV